MVYILSSDAGNVKYYSGIKLSALVKRNPRCLINVISRKKYMSSQASKVVVLV